MAQKEGFEFGFSHFFVYSQFFLHAILSVNKRILCRIVLLCDCPFQSVKGKNKGSKG